MSESDIQESSEAGDIQDLSSPRSRKALVVSALASVGFICVVVGIWGAYSDLSANPGDQKEADYDGVPKVYYDGVHGIPVPRKAYSSGFPSEYVHVIPAESLKKINAVFNSTHVTLKFSPELMISGFARNIDAIGNSASGVIKSAFVYTPFSMFPGTVAMFAEKIHILEHSGPWETASASAAEKFAAPPKESTFDANSTEAFKRAQLIRDASVRPAGKHVGAAGVDLGLMSFARGLVEEGRVHSKENSQAFPSLVAKAKEAMAGKVKTQISLASDNGCYHFEPSPGVEYNKTHFIAPLNKPILGYKGVINGLPNRYYDLSSGTSTWSYDASDGSLVMFFGIFAHMHFQDPEVEQTEDMTGKGSFWVGPIDGNNLKPPPNDTRDTSIGHPLPQWRTLLYNTKRSWAPSTLAMYQDTSEMCSKMFSDGIGSTMYNNVKVFKERVATTEVEQFKVWAEAMEHLAGSAFISNVQPCGNVYVRSDYSGGYNFYDSFETWFWQHFLLEADSSAPEPWWRAYTRRDWDDGIMLRPVQCPANYRCSSLSTR
eukprot:TRINITY_DN32804_c0_g1_i1.p1 TRINITY_DN32804_c0_g1~~TRINITY_DN32804_c0_g1_i1.p1  ORF type:complete len:543 (+),score=44.39 TRINITY_DN32804_c0_g1_i1:271-1899(+)